jgi:hypothetical protein
MSGRARMQYLGSAQIVMLLVIVIAGGWYLNRILGGIFAAIVFLGTVFWISQYLFAMYGLDSRLDAFGALLTFMFRVNLPHMIIGEGRILKKSRSSISRLGGPGMLIIKNDSAVVTELNTRARVLRPGIHLITNRYEMVKEVVDLRPQTRTDTVKAMTKDGFEVEIFFLVGFQIDPGDSKPTEQVPYPFSDKAVLKAVYQSKQVDATGAQLWHERVPGAVFAHVREMIATHYLEDFFEPDNPTSNPRSSHKKWLFDRTKDMAESFGTQLNWVNFSTPTIPDTATRQFLERWQSNLQEKIRVSMTDAKRKSADLEADIKMIEARADAEAEKLKGQVELEKLRQLTEALQGLNVPDEIIAEVLAPALSYLDPNLQYMLRTSARSLGRRSHSPSIGPGRE